MDDPIVENPRKCTMKDQCHRHTANQTMNQTRKCFPHVSMDSRWLVESIIGNSRERNWENPDKIHVKQQSSCQCHAHLSIAGTAPGPESPVKT